MTTTYFAPPAAFRDEWVELPEEEAAHAVRVLRSRPGDVVCVVDGAGGWYAVRLEQADRRGASGVVVERRREVGEPAHPCSIGLALLKNPSRYETFLEKAVELGATEIVPLLTERTEKTHFKAARAAHVLVAALKQSGRSRLPLLHEPRPLEEVLGWGSEAEGRFLCHEAAAGEPHLGEALLRSPGLKAVRVLVGPEGGFTEGEVARAAGRGWTVVSLGPRRLRAETAALAAAAAVLLRPAG